MSDTLSPVLTRADKEEADFGATLAAQFVGATIVAFGATLEGEILLVLSKDGQRREFVFAKDENEEVAIFEVDTAAVQEVWE